MTVSSDLNRISYTGNGTTTVFPVNYYFLQNEHLQVILISATGTETPQTLTANYTVTGAGNEAGGTVTMLVAPPTGTTLVIQREVPATQETDYLANDPFPAESHERALDKLTMLAQQNERESSRALKIPLLDVLTISPELPPATDRANTVLAFDNDGAPIKGPDIASVGVIETNIVNINTVAENISEIDTVASSIANVNNLAAIASDVSVVALNISDVSSVSDNISDVVNVSSNIDDVTNFSDVYLGAKTEDPFVRNNGDTLQAGDLYFNVVDNGLRVYSGTSWDYGSFNITDVDKFEYEIGVTPGTSVGQTEFTGLNLSASSAVEVFYNGSLLYENKDYTYTSSQVTLTNPTSNGDIVIIYNYRFPVSTIDGGFYS